MATKYEDLKVYVLDTAEADFSLADADGAFNIIGNDAVNTLTGNKFDNIIAGGVGADNMIGGGGNDTYYVDNTGDVVTEAANQGIDKVASTISYSLATAGKENIENVTLLGTAEIDATGNDLANVLIGNSGKNILDGGKGNDTLDGGAGVDVMKGGLGDDTYVVDDATEVPVEAADGGTDTVRASVSYTLEGDVKQHLENLTLTGTAALNATGNAKANVLTGNAGSNVLTGAAGRDTFVFDTKLGKTNVDKMDFNVKDDQIFLDNAIFKKLGAGTMAKPHLLKKDMFVLGASAKDKNDYVGYNSKTGKFWYDSNGNKAGGHVDFATADKGLHVSNHDFFVV